MTAQQYADETLGSVRCPNCGADDEPCAEWCAASDPRVANRNQKLRERAGALTKGASILPASSVTSLPGGVQAPFANTSDLEY
jgi:hypothetical protein